MSDPVVFPEGYTYVDRPLARRLYEAYNAGGPPERANLSWDGKPCPSWEQLDAWAAEGKAGPAGVVAKWEAVAAECEEFAVTVLEFTHAPDALQIHIQAQTVGRMLQPPRSIHDLAERGLREAWPRIADLASVEPGPVIGLVGIYQCRIKLGANIITCVLHVAGGA